MIRRVQLSSEPFRDSRTAVLRFIAKLTCELPLDFVRQQSDVLCAMIELGVSERNERKRTGTRARILVDRLRRSADDRLGQVSDRLVDHRIPKRRPQGVLGHHRFRRNSDDRPSAPATPRTRRESHWNANKVQAVSRSVGQIITRIDAPQLVQVVQIVRVLVEYDRGLEGNLALLWRNGDDRPPRRRGRDPLGHHSEVDRPS